MWDRAYTVTTLTGAEEVIIDNRTARSPCCLSADLALLVVQPVSEVWRIIRGVEVGDIIDIPFAGKRTKDFAIAVALGLTASSVGSSVGTAEDLNSS